MKKRGVFLVLLLGFILLFSQEVFADVVTLTMTQNANYVDGEVTNAPATSTGGSFFRVGFDDTEIFRGFMDFDTSSIPDGSTITQVQLKLNVQSSVLVNVNAYSLTQKADTRIEATQPSTLYAECAGTGDDAQVLTASTAFRATTGLTTVTLDSAANSDLQGKLGSNFYSVCLQSTTEGVGNFLTFDSYEGTNDPQLIVTYTPAGETVAPLVTIVNPTNRTYGLRDFPLIFNVSLNEAGNVLYSLTGGINLSMTNLTALGFNASNSSLGDGSWTFKVHANDTLGNINHTEFIVFSVDATSPNVTAKTPDSSNVEAGNVIEIGVNVSDISYVDSVLANVTFPNGSITSLVLSNISNRYNISFVVPSLFGVYNVSFFANDTLGNLNNSIRGNFTVLDLTSPVANLIYPGNGTTVVNNVVYFHANFTDETLLRNVTLEVWNSTGSLLFMNSTNITGTSNSSNLSVVLPYSGSFLWNYRVSDNSSNMGRNATNFTVTYTPDLIAPSVTIASPTNQTYTVDGYSINIRLNEGGFCQYSLNGGTTNSSLTANSTNSGFTGSLSGVSNAGYTLRAYCNDSSGNRNDTEFVNFVINFEEEESGSSGSSGGGGGGGGGCLITSWSCGEWNVCVEGEQQRQCTSNCKTTKNEKRSCEPCVNECSVSGSSCSGDDLQVCQLVDGCYKLTSQKCEYGCSNNQCLLENLNTKTENPLLNNFVGGAKKFTDNAVRCIINPSVCIPHGDLPDSVVNAGVAGVGTAAALGLIWWSVLAILGSTLPFFLIKLRHYSVSVFDSNNHLGIFHNGKIDRHALLEFMISLENNYDKMIFAYADDEVAKYMFKDGFLEIRKDEPFILMAHFSNKKKSKEFFASLRKTMNQHGGKSLHLTETLEKASIIRVFRAWRREIKTKKELGKVFRK